MTKLTASRPAPQTKLKSFTIELTAQEANNLANIVFSFQQMNKALSDSVAKWIAKNMKKLKPLVTKGNALKQSLWNEYVNKNADGEFLYSDYKEGSKLAVVKNDMLVGDEDGIPIAPQLSEAYRFYISDPEKKKEFEAKSKAAAEEKYPVQIEQLNQDLLASVNIPAQADLVALYEVLTFDEAEGEIFNPTDKV